MQLNPNRAKQDAQRTKNPQLSELNVGMRESAAKRLDQVFIPLIQKAYNSKDHSVLRLPDSAKKMGRANSTYWQDVKNGLAPPPIRLGERAVGWLTFELDAILAARALASRTNKPLDIKLFVSILAAPRLSLKEPTTGSVEGVENV